MTNRSADIGASGVGSIMGAERYRPYPAYKNSGVEWLGKIPAHWEEKRLKHLATVNDEALPETTDPSMEITYVDIGNVDSIQGITDVEELVFENAPSRARRIVRQGDVIISTVRTYLRAIAQIQTTDANLIVSTGFAVIRPRQMDDGFVAYAVNAPYFVERVVAHSVGVSYPAINASELACLDIAFPSLPEQRTIAAFLDRETAKIDALVAKKERLIELLQEKRTALISDAVTKGLDPDVPLKDAGVEWLGEIPAHWEIMRLKQVSRIQGGFAFSTDSFRNEGIPVIRMNNIRRGVLELDNVVRIPEHKCKDEFALNEGDIIYGLSGSIGATGSLGNYAVVRKGDTPAQLNQRVARFRPVMDRIIEKFLIGSLQTSVFYEQVLSYTTGTAQFNVSTNDIGNVVLALPPIKEQRAIAAFLDRETTPVDALMAKVQEAIDHLKELRTALISAAVTGKIDVRETTE